MGIINGLLTGGVLVGKICQAVGGLLGGKHYYDAESGLTVQGVVELGDVKFFGAKTKDGATQVNAFNQNSASFAEVAIPNNSEKAGVTYLIAPTEKVPVAEILDSKVSPHVEIKAGLTNNPTQQVGVADPKSLFNLSFTGLKIGSWTGIGSFKLSCTTTQLLIVCGTVIAGMLTYFSLRSDKGVTAFNQNPIMPTGLGDKNELGETTVTFPIDFAKLNFDMNNDSLSGDAQFTIAATSDQLRKLSHVPSVPLHPAEKRFFQLLSEGKL